MIHPPAFTGFASHALQLLQKVHRGTSDIELVYTAHERWPFRPGQTTHSTHPTLRISVLDSSFNPPTLAHLALANSLPPPAEEPYDARILLLSVRNADKVLKPGDATFVQRLEMMRLLSHDVRYTDTVESGSESLQMGGNVAVAIIDEPTFVGKSTLLLRFLCTRLAAVVESTNSPDIIFDKKPCPFPSPKLTFLLGFDTLVRLFSPKYYPSELAMDQMLRKLLSSDQEDCRIVCAYRRSVSVDETFRETQAETSVAAHEFTTSDRIAFIDIGTEEQTYSSSEVRAKIAARDGSWRRLVTEAVAQYIIQQGIHAQSSDSERER